ncbi:MAG: hypothetical protein RBQ65_01580, partial [Sphaerochaeta sp.]|nr:hypothetical protein [Sphaerochaeta sp.]
SAIVFFLSKPFFHTFANYASLGPYNRSNTGPTQKLGKNHGDLNRIVVLCFSISYKNYGNN